MGGKRVGQPSHPRRPVQTLCDVHRAPVCRSCKGHRGGVALLLRPGDLKSAPGEGGGGWHGRPPKGGLKKWASLPSPLFGVRMDVGAKGAGTQILA